MCKARICMLQLCLKPELLFCNKASTQLPPRYDGLVIHVIVLMVQPELKLIAVIAAEHVATSSSWYNSTELIGKGRSYEPQRSTEPEIRFRNYQLFRQSSHAYSMAVSPYRVWTKRKLG